LNKTIGKVNFLDPKFVEAVKNAFENIELDEYEIGWKKLQVIAVETIKKIIKSELKDIIITIPKSKSTYPDIKFENEDGVFAIDIKSNESQKDPWFDMARLDTIIEERIQKYTEEWEVVIKYNSETKKLLNVYFNLFREVVGKRHECDGVKYRPYDGKIRPKTWKDFDNNVIFWNSKADFLLGIKKSLKHRWKENIKKHLIPQLTDNEKKEFQKLFEK